MCYEQKFGLWIVNTLQYYFCSKSHLYVKTIVKNMKNFINNVLLITLMIK
ncbi:integrase [Salmonella enterica subsp. arizonae]|uniref:Integrase n=1 Tax=Salmonella enterica subsp. arizonae TaxID=59203 RepID=A0A3S4GY83_SALER|nr:integrase [Salmonella enterica subsp. arizonae]